MKNDLTAEEWVELAEMLYMYEDNRDGEVTETEKIIIEKVKKAKTHMVEQEFEHQKSLVNSVLGSTDVETIEEWADLTAEDYWYGLTQGGYLSGMLKALESKGVNTDSVKVMSYVDKQLYYLVS